MGKQISKFSQKFCMKTSYYKVLLLGLEGVGKTTLFDRIKSNEVYVRNPTIGFNAENIKLDSMIVSLWDFGGHEKVMKLMYKYFDHTDLVIIVLDCTDTDNLDKIQNLFQIVKDKLGDVCVIVILNKTDLRGAMKTDDLLNQVDIYKYGLKIGKIIRTSLVNGDGVKEVIRTMTAILKQK